MSYKSVLFTQLPCMICPNLVRFSPIIFVMVKFAESTDARHDELPSIFFRHLVGVETKIYPTSLMHIT